MNLLLILALISGHAFDGLTTYVGLKDGAGTEKNPVARLVFSKLGLGLGIVLYKAVAVSAFIWLASLANASMSPWVLIAGTAFGILAGLWNLTKLKQRESRAD